MNFNIFTILVAVCASMIAAENSGAKNKLVDAPPVRGHNKNKKGHKIVPSRPRPSPLQLAASSYSRDHSKLCTRKLENIIYAPSSNVKTFMAGIAANIRADIKIIMDNFAAGNLDYLRTFVNKYNVLITVAGAFGQPVIVTPTFNGYAGPFQSVATAQNYVGVDGFYNDPINQYYHYKFNVQSVNGQFITFDIALLLSAMTLNPTDDCKK